MWRSGRCFDDDETKALIKGKFGLSGPFDAAGLARFGGVRSREVSFGCGLLQLSGEWCNNAHVGCCSRQPTRAASSAGRTANPGTHIWHPEP